MHRLIRKINKKPKFHMNPDVPHNINLAVDMFVLARFEIATTYTASKLVALIIIPQCIESQFK